MKKFLYDIKIEGTLLKEKNDDELNLRIHETKKKLRLGFKILPLIQTLHQKKNSVF